ncbi:MAG: polyprenyl synthetase family protein [Candidatus Micrarchaeota archaeon]|nr:polyprenyl synthetase family protein [Candidatus Micrarchaeota archaeon]
MVSNVEEILKEYSDLINAEISKYLSDKVYPKSVYQPIKDFLNLGGKRFRPALTLISSEMFGLKREQALKPAIAIELFHNFTLIHDDIEDNSDMRRGKPCIHRTYGIPLAINAGDGLFILVWDILANLDYDFATTKNVQKELVNTFKYVLEGQGMELEWITNNKWEIDEEDYYEMVFGKTASLISGSLAIGGIIAKKDENTVDKLREFGKLIGIAFQIQDDYLNLFGRFEDYKKEIGGDISEGKRTLMTIHAMKNLSQNDSRELKSILSKKTKDQKEIVRAISLIEKAESHIYAKNRAQNMINEALKIADIYFPKNVYRDRLISISKYLINRKQ